MRDRKSDAHRPQTERRLGRKLSTNEVVHHKDGDKSNNNPTNHEVKTRAQHSRDHAANPGLLKLQKALTMPNRKEKLY